MRKEPKLKLHRETLRKLDEALDKVVGGINPTQHTVPTATACGPQTLTCPC